MRVFKALAAAGLAGSLSVCGGGDGPVEPPTRTLEIVIAGETAHDEVRAMLATLRGRFLPNRVVCHAGPGSDPDLIPLLAQRDAPAGEARAFVCHNYACNQPVSTAEELERELD